MTEESCRRVVESLRSNGWRTAEVFAKSGSSRRFELEAGRTGSVSNEERGWGVRAGDRESSFFFSASGSPTPEPKWPQPLGGGLRLPPALPVGRWRPSAELDTPLLGEREGLSFLQSVAETLNREAPGCRLERAILEDGASETQILTTEGVQVSYRSRLSTIRIEASLGPSQMPSCSIYVAKRTALDFEASALARRMADLLHVRARGRMIEREAAEILLSPPVATRLLAGMAGQFVGAETDATWWPRGSTAGSAAVTLVDDGRFPEGLLQAPVDGEGVPTRACILIEEGRAADRLVPWWQSKKPWGCRPRAGWRELPTTGPSHLYLVPTADISVVSLLSSLRRGYYVIEALGDGSFDHRSGQFSLPICGFEVDRGQPATPVANLRLEGNLRHFLERVRGVARDLTFLPHRGLVGSPSLLVDGLRLRSAG